ncbi:excisionase family DNA-binding protein [Chryseobacterium sp. JV274]|uniref:excisionase family DNA-binding protein n=1 Tax=Chryseobacterium sp. JV274 TaxID=1932669 RepID=UPI000984ACE3|nr:helix-turn-helix domain-containing protein [Chryseobacterium sp. JV274]
MDTMIFDKLNELESKIDSLSLSNKEILTMDEAGNYLGISKSYLYKLTSSKEISHYKPSGKLIYFKRGDLDSWLLRNKESGFTETSDDLIQNLKDRRNGKN